MSNIAFVLIGVAIGMAIMALGLGRWVIDRITEWLESL